LHFSDNLDKWTNTLVVLKENCNSQDQARDLGSKEVLEWEFNVCSQITECSLVLLKFCNVSRLNVILDVSSEPNNECQTADEKNGICKMKNDWKLVESSQSFCKNEGYKVLQ